MGIERRDTLRLDVAWKATLTRLNGEQLPGSTDNVSVSGINVIQHKTLVVGEPVKIELIAKCTRGLCYFSLEGAVVYSRTLESGLGTAIGLRLLQADDEFIDLLHELSGTLPGRIAG